MSFQERKPYLLIKAAIKKAYGNKGEKNPSRSNYGAVDNSIENLFEVEVPDKAGSEIEMQLCCFPKEAPDYVQKVIAEIISGNGDSLPSSAFEPDGTFPTATTQWEKRNIALEIPVLDPTYVCMQLW
ncbi:MAG: hypothetical protein U5K71_05325 [Gracilimonas sp.]|nr:hypothetical protein [Gracilimonas sp.]